MLCLQSNNTKQPDLIPPDPACNFRFVFWHSTNFKVAAIEKQFKYIIYQGKGECSDGKDDSGNGRDFL
jgi:hypothetical protein